MISLSKSEISVWLAKQAIVPAPQDNLSGEYAIDYAQTCLALFTNTSNEWVQEPKFDTALRNIGANIGEILSEGIEETTEVALVVTAAVWLGRIFHTLAEPLPALFGFWDSVLTHFFEPELWSEHPLLQDACFGALLIQLSSPNRFCQLSALHGLNHLRHPRTGIVIDWFLSMSGDRELRDYASMARKFEAM